MPKLTTRFQKKSKEKAIRRLRKEYVNLRDSTRLKYSPVELSLKMPDHPSDIEKLLFPYFEECFEVLKDMDTKEWVHAFGYGTSIETVLISPPEDVYLRMPSKARNMCYKKLTHYKGGFDEDGNVVGEYLQYVMKSGIRILIDRSGGEKPSLIPENEARMAEIKKILMDKYGLDVYGNNCRCDWCRYDRKQEMERKGHKTGKMHRHEVDNDLSLNHESVEEDHLSLEREIEFDKIASELGMTVDETFSYLEELYYKKLSERIEITLKEMVSKEG